MTHMAVWTLGGGPTPLSPVRCVAQRPTLYLGCDFIPECLSRVRPIARYERRTAAGDGTPSPIGCVCIGSWHLVEAMEAVAAAAAFADLSKSLSRASDRRAKYHLNCHTVNPPAFVTVSSFFFFLFQPHSSLATLLCGIPRRTLSCSTFLVPFHHTSISEETTTCPNLFSPIRPLPRVAQTTHTHEIASTSHKPPTRTQATYRIASHRTSHRSTSYRSTPVPVAVMAGKKGGGENSKKAAGNARKAEAAAQKAAADDAKKAAAEDAEWSKGSKSNAKK